MDEKLLEGTGFPLSEVAHTLRRYPFSPPGDDPGFIAEILSPSTRQRDLVFKRESYVELGVRYYAIIDPDSEVVELLVKQGDRYVASSDGTLTLSPECHIEVDLQSLFRAEGSFTAPLRGEGKIVGDVLDPLDEPGEALES